MTALEYARNADDYALLRATAAKLVDAGVKKARKFRLENAYPPDPDPLRDDRNLAGCQLRDPTSQRPTPSTTTTAGTQRAVMRQSICTLLTGHYSEPDSDANTGQQCLDQCHSLGYTWAGVEFGRECYCGNGLTPDYGSSTGCDMRCTGDESQICGGINAINVYQYSEVLSSYGGYTVQGCVAETDWRGGEPRRLPDAGFANDSMTVGACVDFCKGAGYHFAGLEYARECYCGNLPSNETYPPKDWTPTTIDQCFLGCAGNTSQACGSGECGEGCLLIYSDIVGTSGSSGSGTTGSSGGTSSGGSSGGSSSGGSSGGSGTGDGGSSSGNSGASGSSGSEGSGESSCWESAGCYSAESLPFVNGLIDILSYKCLHLDGPLSVEVCQDACSAKGFNVCGIVDGTTCRCSTLDKLGQLLPGLLEVLKTNDNQCNTVCPGNKDEFCGGSSKISLYLNREKA
ncbi:Cell wall integrity and stress response component 2 [Stygiomarasmius scandens]|uniref:Cell wall integrity and stress response component 2 n=1 Tax=Marasmiellus scandens TaxID=2682957 RepID=A0ABR1JE96_9AGAR